jgi:hypothetical protein
MHRTMNIKNDNLFSTNADYNIQLILFKLLNSDSLNSSGLLFQQTCDQSPLKLVCRQLWRTGAFGRVWVDRFGTGKYLDANTKPKISRAQCQYRQHSEERAKQHDTSAPKKTTRFKQDISL